MPSLSDRSSGAPRARVASYAVIIAAVVFAAAIVIVMNRLQDTLGNALDEVEEEYRETQQIAPLARHIHTFAQQSMEALMRPTDAAQRQLQVQDVRKAMSEVTAWAQERLRGGGDDEARSEARDIAEMAELLEVFIQRTEELLRSGRDAPDFQARFDATYQELFRGRLLKSVYYVLQDEWKDEDQKMAAYHEMSSKLTWGVSILIVILIGLIVTPLYLRLDKGVRRLTEGAHTFAAGDYAARVDVKGMFRQISDAFNGMATRIQEHRQAQVKMAKELQVSSAELLAVAKQTETNAADEAAAVEETRHTMQALLASATLIAQGADSVASKAEHSTRASEGIGEQIMKLSAQSQKIRKITVVIQSIADKSDILALNAALEGAKAGEAGRGFVLLGEEMRRLAESVTNASHEVADLASEIEELSKGAVMSTEVGQRFASETLEVAQQITLITSQQRSATEQVSRSMEEVHRYTQQSLSAAKQTRSTASDLVRTSGDLEKLVDGRSTEGPLLQRA